MLRRCFDQYDRRGRGLISEEDLCDALFDAAEKRRWENGGAGIAAAGMSTRSSLIPDVKAFIQRHSGQEGGGASGGGLTFTEFARAYAEIVMTDSISASVDDLVSRSLGSPEARRIVSSTVAARGVDGALFGSKGGGADGLRAARQGLMVTAGGAGGAGGGGGGYGGSGLQVDQVATLKAAFNKLDMDHDGIITAREMMASMRAQGRSSSPQEAQKWIASLDLTGDGTVTFPEFVAGHRSLFAPRDAGATLRDGGGGGGGGAGEFSAINKAFASIEKRAMRHTTGGGGERRGGHGRGAWRSQVSVSEAEQLRATFQRYDRDGNGRIEVGELRRALGDAGMGGGALSDDALGEWMRRAGLGGRGGRGGIDLDAFAAAYVRFNENGEISSHGATIAGGEARRRREGGARGHEHGHGRGRGRGQDDYDDDGYYSDDARGGDDDRERAVRKRATERMRDFNDAVDDLEGDVTDGRKAQRRAEQLEVKELERMLGVKNSSQLAEVRLAFDTFNPDGDGYIHVSDVLSICASLGYQTPTMKQDLQLWTRRWFADKNNASRWSQTHTRHASSSSSSSSGAEGGAGGSQRLDFWGFAHAFEFLVGQGVGGGAAGGAGGHGGASASNRQWDDDDSNLSDYRGDEWDAPTRGGSKQGRMRLSDRDRAEEARQDLEREERHRRGGTGWRAKGSSGSGRRSDNWSDDDEGDRGRGGRRSQGGRGGGGGGSGSSRLARLAADDDAFK